MIHKTTNIKICRIHEFSHHLNSPSFGKKASDKASNNPTTAYKTATVLIRLFISTLLIPIFYYNSLFFLHL